MANRSIDRGKLVGASVTQNAPWKLDGILFTMTTSSSDKQYFYCRTEAKAERLIAEACRQEAVDQEQLSRWRKGHPSKVKLELKLRSETTLTVAWNAERLQMGTREHLAQLLSASRKPLVGAAQPTLGI